MHAERVDEAFKLAATASPTQIVESCIGARNEGGLRLRTSQRRPARASVAGPCGVGKSPIDEANGLRGSEIFTFSHISWWERMTCLDFWREPYVLVLFECG